MIEENKKSPDHLRTGFLQYDVQRHLMLSTTVRVDFHYSSFVHTFINSFSIGLTLWAERYKFPAQQQALSLAEIMQRPPKQRIAMDRKGKLNEGHSDPSNWKWGKSLDEQHPAAYFKEVLKSATVLS